MQKVLLHPTYFPSALAMQVLSTSVVVWEVSDNYQKQTYRNRAYIYGANGKQLLSVPILHTGSTGRQLYKDVKVDNSTAWQKIHWKTLQTAYRTSPFFEFYEDALYPIFEKRYTFLLDLNFSSIEVVLGLLKLSFPTDRTTAYEAKPMAASDYRWLANAKESVEFRQQEYYQVFSSKGGFLQNLSVLDVLFHCGNDTLRYLKEEISLVS